MSWFRYVWTYFDFSILDRELGLSAWGFQETKKLIRVVIQVVQGLGWYCGVYWVN